jgi:hypothetical protein
MTDLKDELAFALRVANVDWETRELIVTLVKMEDTLTLDETTKAANLAMGQLQALVIARYREAVERMGAAIWRDTRDARIKMQGGL